MIKQQQPYLGIVYKSALLAIRWLLAGGGKLETFDDGLEKDQQKFSSADEASLTVLPEPLNPTMRVRGVWK